METARWLAEFGLPTERGDAAAQAAGLDSVYLVELYPLADPSSIAQTVLAVLWTLVNRILDRHMLLVLDNCEHLVGAAAQFVQVLQGCPNLRILAASRERLNLAAETVYPVAPLAAPDLHPLPILADIADS